MLFYLPCCCWIHKGTYTVSTYSANTTAHPMSLRLASPRLRLTQRKCYQLALRFKFVRADGTNQSEARVGPTLVAESAENTNKRQ